MSKKYSAANTSPAPPGPADRPDSPTVVPVLGNDAARTLWDALAARPGATAAALADVSGVGLSTARRLLTNWEVVGAAASLTDLASPRAAKAWTAGSAALESESTTTEPVTPAEDADRAVDALDSAPESHVAAPDWRRSHRSGSGGPVRARRRGHGGRGVDGATPARWRVAWPRRGLPARPPRAGVHPTSDRERTRPLQRCGPQRPGQTHR